MNALFETIQAGRQILVVCPCCGELNRLSDLKLKYSGPSPKTWVDKYEDKIRLLEDKKAAFDEKEEEIREISKKRGRAKVDKMIRRTLEQTLDRCTRETLLFLASDGNHIFAKLLPGDVSDGIHAAIR